MTLDEHKAKMAAEDEALRREAWALNAPVRDGARRMAELFNREIEAGHADMDAKERAIDEHGYGGPR